MIGIVGDETGNVLIKMIRWRKATDVKFSKFRAVGEQGAANNRMEELMDNKDLSLMMEGGKKRPESRQPRR